MSSATAQMRPIVAAGIVVLAGLLAGCGKPKTADDYIREATARRAAGDLPAALIDLKNALQREPKNVAARELLGRMYLDVPDPASAEAELLRARQEDPGDPELRQPLAQAELLLGKPQAAMTETEDLAGISPRLKVGLMAERAQALLALGRTEEARETLEAALAEDGRSIDVLAAMVRYALAVHDLPMAQQRLAQAKDVDPTSVAVASLEGSVTFASGDFAASERAFHRMYDLARWNLSAYLGMARAEAAQGKLDEADRNLAVALKAAPMDPNANYLSALVAYQRQDYVRAQRAAERTLNVAKGFAPGLLVAGAASRALEQYEQASAYLSQYVYLVPQNVQARKLLASVQLQLGYPGDAMNTLAKVAQGSEDAELLRLIGVAAARSGDLASADRYLQLALARQPDDAGLRAQFAMAELALGRTDIGVDELERAAKAEPAALRPEIVLFATYLRSGQFDKAAEVAQRVQKARPSEAVGHDLAGLAYLGEGESATAQLELERAREIHPGDALALRLLAALAFREGKLDTARRYLREIIDVNPTDVQAQIGLAELEIQERHPEAAEAVLRRAIQEAPESAPARLMLGRLLLFSGRDREALSTVEPALAQSSQYPALLEIAGRAQLAMRNPEGATGAFKALVALQPEASSAHRHLGQAYAAAGDVDLSLSEARRAFDLDANNPAARGQLARAYLAKGDLAEARKLTDDLVKIRLDDPAVAELQGQLALAEGRPEDAVTAFQRQLSLADAVSARIHLARALMLAGRLDGAEETLRSWIVAHSDDADARLSLGDIYLASHRLDDAAAQYAAVAEKQPDNVAAHNNLAWILSMEGKREDALVHARRAVDLAPKTPEVLDTLGVVLLQSNHASEAVSALQSAASSAPANSEIQFHLAQALAGAGNREAARGLLRKLLATDTPFSQRDEARKLLEELGS